jgi:hypothetical protein
MMRLYPSAARASQILKNIFLRTLFRVRSKGRAPSHTNLIAELRPHIPKTGLGDDIGMLKVNALLKLNPLNSKDLLTGEL